MKTISSKNDTVIFYTDDRVTIKLHNEGTGFIFTRDSFDDFLLFLNYANAVMGKDKAFKKKDDKKGN